MKARGALTGMILVVLAAGAACALAGFDWAPLLRLPTSLWIWLVLLQLLINLLSAGMSALLLAAVGCTVSFARLFLITHASLAGNYIVPGRIGIPARAYLQQELLGVSLAASTAGMAIEVLLGLALAIVLGTVGAVMIFGKGTVVVALVLAGAVLLSCFAALRVAAVRWGNSSGADTGHRSRFVQFAADSLAALRSMRRQPLAAATLVLLVVVGAGFLRAYFLVLGLGFAPPFLPFVCACSLAYSVGQLSLVPMGLGAKDVSLVALLTKVGLPGTTAIGYAAVDRATGTGCVILLGLLCSAILVFLHRRLLSQKSRLQHVNRDGSPIDDGRATSPDLGRACLPRGDTLGVEE